MTSLLLRHRDLHRQRQKQLAAELRRIAQNDYMIDAHMLDDGKLLMEAAGWMDPLVEGTLPQNTAAVRAYEENAGKEKPESDFSARA